MSQPSSPPVPQKLQEMLKDYPEYIDRLQNDLMRVITKPSKSTPPFEVAIWELEGTLETFISEARAELKAAEASGDRDAIARAKLKRSILGSARADMGNMSDLQVFFKGSI